MSKDERIGAKVVVIGGGTGSFTLLSGLKHYAKHITALVNMADDGGSTGVLRDELGVLPPGDVRQCLVALSNSEKVRDLFNYRFEEGTLKGHAFGNLFLTALEKMTGSFPEAVELASEVLNTSGKVDPITLENVTLCLDDGSKEPTKGEFTIGHMKFHKQRPRIWLEPTPQINPLAAQAIIDADLVVIAPGNLYGSLAPALIVEGMATALKKSKAKKIYVCNLVTKPGQTDKFMVHDFADEIERFVGSKFLDYVLFNTTTPEKDLLSRYAKDGEYAVEIDSAALKQVHYKPKGADLLAEEIWQGAQSSDPIASARSFIRHDSDKIARQLMRIYFS